MERQGHREEPCYRTYKVRVFGALASTCDLNLRHTGFIPPSIMMPQRRFAALMEQAFGYQRTNCLYHNTPYAPETFSLYTDHRCSREDFPLLTTNILKEHDDEVWNIKWSHDGQYLASASRDKSAFIWLIGVSSKFVNNV